MEFVAQFISSFSVALKDVGIYTIYCTFLSFHIKTSGIIIIVTLFFKKTSFKLRSSLHV